MAVDDVWTFFFDEFTDSRIGCRFHVVVTNRVASGEAYSLRASHCSV